MCELAVLCVFFMQLEKSSFYNILLRMYLKVKYYYTQIKYLISNFCLKVKHLKTTSFDSTKEPSSGCMLVMSLLRISWNWLGILYLLKLGAAGHCRPSKQILIIYCYMMSIEVY